MARPRPRWWWWCALLLAALFSFNAANSFVLTAVLKNPLARGAFAPFRSSYSSPSRSSSSQLYLSDIPQLPETTTEQKEDEMDPPQHFHDYRSDKDDTGDEFIEGLVTSRPIDKKKVVVKLYNNRTDDDDQNNNKQEEKHQSRSSSDNKQQQSKVKLNLVKAPEDIFTMTGDLLALSIYGYLDHFISQDVAHFMVQNANTDAKLSALYQDVFDKVPTIPSWLDYDSSSTELVANRLWHDQLTDVLVVPYTGIFATTGTSVVALSILWILSASFITGALDMEHTLQCHTDHVLIKTFHNWCIMMIILFTTCFFVNNINILHHSNNDSLSFLTVPDVTFVVGTLSVLSLWRFMVNQLFGTGPE